MSRIWKTPVKVPNNVTVNLNDSIIKVTWPKWSLSFKYEPNVDIVVDEWNMLVKRIDDEKLSKSLHGLTRSIVSNMVKWVSEWFEKRLQILWVWYSYSVQWKKVVLSLWFSHPVHLEIPEWIKAEIDPKEKNIMIISWIDKQRVWEFAANIRKLKLPEPYKWKWIRYLWEYVFRKAGKTTGK